MSPRFVRASNTGTIIGWRWGVVNVAHCSLGTTSRYRNGLMLRVRRSRICFVPLTRYRTLNV